MLWALMKMGDRYQTFRSISDVHVFVLCYERAFYERDPGTFAGRTRGGVSPQVDALKPEYRVALARDGYTGVRCGLAVFKPEV